MAYINLSRRFRDLPQSELESAERLAALNETRWPGVADGSVGWAELLEHPRVLLLAEAGSGKTEEMRWQARRLQDEGQCAFFVPLEALANQDLAEILDSQGERDLERWKSDGESPAWFFLDAVDELKLIQGKLGKALNRFAKAIDGNLNRARCVISCRPSDFRPSTDLTIIREKLPFTPIQDIQRLTSDEFFIEVMSEKKSRREVNGKVQQKDGLRSVVLLPLSEPQISTFVDRRGVADPNLLIEEIRRRDAWIFACRPLDLILLAESWKRSRALGTRLQQHEANVTARLMDDPERPDRGALSSAKARTGAEWLALALTLTQTRTIRSPDQILGTDRTEGVLDPAEVLTDWTPEERQALLRRGLFDPATYGRVRFHHRSVQEYLAACKLKDLRVSGMSSKSLNRLLFAEPYGVPLVKPSMQAIAAWLALWDDDVRRELLKREPETLLSMGDPESLSIDQRAQLLRSFSKLYGEGGWRGLDIPPSEVLRLASPELAGVVRELWEGKPSSPEVAELLLGMIWHGPIGECADIARSAALDVGQPAIQRVFAIRALLACGKTEALHEVRESILSDAESWPDQVVHAAVGDLFPEVLTVSQLISLVERTREPKDSGGLSWEMRKIVETIDPSTIVATELREALADLIWSGRNEELEWFRYRGRFDSLAPALALLCGRQLEVASSRSVPEARLVWACVVANRFGKDESGARDAVKELKIYFQERTDLREAAFWTELKLTSQAVRPAGSWNLYFHAVDGSLIEDPTAGDRTWLLDALQSSPERDRRLAALHALVLLWGWGGRDDRQLDDLRSAVQGDVELTTLLAERSAPPEPIPGEEERRRQVDEAKRQGERERSQRLESWTKWKEDLLADTDGAFAGENFRATIRNLYHFLRRFQGDTSNSLSAWNVDALRNAFEEDITLRAEAAFRKFWRENPPTLRSALPPADQNRIPLTWNEGLTGLAAEAKVRDWAKQLTPDEARIAAGYATVELNGFPGWLRDVAAVYPDVVGEVLWNELTAERNKNDGHTSLRTLQDLSQADLGVKKLLATRLREWLPNWPSSFQDEQCRQQSALRLEQVLGILSDVAEGSERTANAWDLGPQFSDRPSGPLASVWLRSLFRLDSERATSAFENALAALPEEERSAFAVEMFGNAIGHRGGVVFSGGEVSLGRLVRCAYRYVRPDEDQAHEGIFSLDARDEAQRAREFLLGMLLDTPGAEAREAILDLAGDPSFQHFPDRLRLLARRRAALDAEGPALRPEDVVALEKRFETPPCDRDGLFALMIDRLDDMAHDIAHDDFSDRRTLQKVDDESEMQRTLAWRLRNAANGSYIVAREEEVADLKKTDIRLLATRGDQKAVVEVKIADNRWTLPGLEGALRDQLVGQYLRHATCKAGCLLLTYNGTKKYWEHPETSQRLSFAEVVKLLEALALLIEEQEGYKVRLAVRALDLTDPPLKSALKDKQASRKRRSANVRPA